MIEDTSKGLFNLFLWSVVPKFFASFVLNQYYKLSYPSAASRPKPGSSKFRKHFVLAYSAVMVVYFAYCVGQTVYDLPVSYYERMGILRKNADTDLKSRYRSLVLKLHPDKNPGADPEKFQEIKQVYDVLENADLRTAYEVFGETVIQSTGKSSKKNKNMRHVLRDYFETAFLNWSVANIGSLIMLIIMSLISKNSGMYWRITGLLFSACLELYVMVSPDSSLEFDKAYSVLGLKKYTVHEKLIIFRSVIVNLSIIITQLLSLLETPEKPEQEELLELAKGIDAMVSGPLSRFAADDKAEVSEVLEKDDNVAKVFKQSLGKFLSRNAQ